MNEERNFSPLDPGWDDPGYWTAFRASVMDRARLELARRREAIRLTVPTVLFGWSRGLVPAALAAAAIAGFMVVSEQGAAVDPEPLALEDIVSEEAEAMRAFLDEASDWAPTAFMALVEGERP
ncbi:MAG: hypothetical protein HKO53_01590 [Gemmatimonadetes bacterium]|nr:hypothetical protein [Gemmatimonadota bacterium]